MLRRDEHPAAADERAEHVGVDQMGVQDVGVPNRAGQPAHGAEARVWNLTAVELVVEGLRIPAFEVVEPDEARVDAQRAQRRE